MPGMNRPIPHEKMVDKPFPVDGVGGKRHAPPHQVEQHVGKMPACPAALPAYLHAIRLRGIPQQRLFSLFDILIEQVIDVGCRLQCLRQRNQIAGFLMNVSHQFPRSMPMAGKSGRRGDEVMPLAATEIGFLIDLSPVSEGVELPVAQQNRRLTQPGRPCQRCQQSFARFGTVGGNRTQVVDADPAGPAHLALLVGVEEIAEPQLKL